MDIQVILDAAEFEAPGLRELAWRFLVADAGHPGVPLDLARVLACRAEGVPEVHVAGTADRLPEHLEATEENAFDEDSILMALARIGAQAIMTRAELGEPTRQP